MSGGFDRRAYLIAAERVLAEALGLGGRRGRAFARLAHFYLQKAFEKREQVGAASVRKDPAQRLRHDGLAIGQSQILTAQVA
jgi:hypothetical protein